MSKAFFAENGLAVFCDSGVASFSDNCPCGCPSFDGRSIIYVDKHASGTGDGSSWANAYTDIQTAINAHPEKEIQIQGYGNTDFYLENLSLLDCIYLKGVGDLWIKGLIAGGGTTSTKLELLNVLTVIDTMTSFEGCNNSIFLNCKALSSATGSRGFEGNTFCSFVNCIADTSGSVGFGSNNDSSFVNCESINQIQFGFYQNMRCLFDTCSVNNVNQWGFYNNSYGNFVLCTSENNQVGYTGNSDSTFTDCIAENNINCGYVNNNNPVFINCQDINNCTSGSPLCTPGDPLYNCDTV